jgi:hypothetical protein
MVAVANTDPVELFGRYRFRGLDPKSVELWAMNFEHENADLRAQLAALEARAAKADSFAEDAVREMVAMQGIIKQGETDQAIFAARQRLFREEAAQIVHDAWAEANVVRAQTQQLRERTQAQLEAAKEAHEYHLAAMREKMMAEIEATLDEVRATMATECAEHQSRIAAEHEEHQSRIAALEGECARIVAEIETYTTNALDLIAPLKQAAARADLSMTTQTGGAAHDATEALILLGTTMRRSLTEPAAEGVLFAPEMPLIAHNDAEAAL